MPTKLTVKQSFSSFIIAIMIALTVAMTLVFGIQVSKKITNLKKQNLDEYLSAVLSDMSTYTQVRVNDLEAIVKSPILVQGLMQPEAQLASVADLFKDSYIQAEQPQQVLIDFSGEVIYSRYPTQWKGLEQPLMDDMETFVRLQKMNQEFQILLASPIRYQGSVEGLLVTLITLNKMLMDLNLNQRLEGINLKFSHNNQKVFNIGQGAYPIRKNLNTTWLGLNVSYCADDKDIKELVSLMQMETFLFMLILGIVTTTIAVILGQKLFVSPIQKLSSQMTCFDMNNLVKKDFHSPIKELEDVSAQFKQLATNVSVRERELRQAYDQIKESKVQLLQSEKMASIGMLAAGIAHEINNPLGFIKSNIDTLNEYHTSIETFLNRWNNSTFDSDEVKPLELRKFFDQENLLDLIKDGQEITDECMTGLLRVEEIVKGLKLFSRSDIDEASEFYLAEQLELTLKLAWNELKYSASVNKQIHQDFKCVGYPGQINQVILNFLVNAAQALDKKHGKINIDVGLYDENRGYISVEDNGCGIDREAIKDLFTPFYTTKPPGQGTGLGLSISYGIAKNHKGEIKVESLPGAGSTFTLILPVSNSSTTPLSVEEPRPSLAC